jgi:hypothetical protein
MDLEGVVAKHKFGPYIEDRESSSWFKIVNRNYSQKLGGKNCLSEIGRSRFLLGTGALRLVGSRTSDPAPELRSVLF